MKKNLTWILLAVMSLTLSFTATSCSDDKNDDPASIVGEWYLANEKGFYHEGDEKISFDESYTKDNAYVLVKFIEGGTGVSTYKAEDEEDEDESVNFTWSIADNKLTVTEYGETEVSTIIKLDSSTLTLQQKGTDETGEWEDNVTFKKM